MFWFARAPLPGGFFFSAWLTMVFWGIIGPKVGLGTISYPLAMLVTIALWLIAFPLILAKGGGGWWKRW